MENMLDFSGKAVIVTGGGKGVGRGITECFLAAGADVLICGRSEPESLPHSGERKALFTACDVGTTSRSKPVWHSRCSILAVLMCW